jgi:hypothetical protein
MSTFCYGAVWELTLSTGDISIFKRNVSIFSLTQNGSTRPFELSLRRFDYRSSGSAQLAIMTFFSLVAQAQRAIELVKRMIKHRMSDQKFRVEQRKRLKAQRKARRRLLLSDNDF